MNKVILIGNLTRAPELRTTGTGKSVCSFSIAVDRRMKNKDGERVTDFFNIITWGQLAELCSKYLDKGRKACVVGEIQNRSYEKDGIKHTVTDIVADSVEFLSAYQPVKESNEELKEEFTDVDVSDLPF